MEDNLSELFGFLQCFGSYAFTGDLYMLSVVLDSESDRYIGDFICPLCEQIHTSILLFEEDFEKSFMEH